LTRLREALETTRAAGRAALVPYLTAGDPSLDATVEYAGALVDGGADVLELGVPFSDPLADGPVIQRAAERALAAGTRVRDVIDVAGRIRAAHDVPLVVMTYLNPVLRYGWERFCADAAAAGVAGTILTDVPPEEAGPFRAAAEANGLGTVFLVAPTSGPERIRAAVEVTTGFLYCVTRLGVTGERSELAGSFREVLETVRAISDVPVGLGFGISTPEQAREAGRHADAVIVGSALVALAAGAGSPAAAAEALRDAARGLRGALEEARTA
jgi:tryptophan synthase alpha chain